MNVGINQVNLNMSSVSSSAGRINAVLRELSGSSYLEVGVAKGTTFFEVAAARKVAVDPRFRFDTKDRGEYLHETYYSISSDEFFADAIGRRDMYDLIFLDGLHTYPQTLKDFLSSLAVAHNNSIWIIDDTVPNSAVAAEADLQRVRQARNLLGESKDETWMGDVFKVVAFIDSFLPQFSCFTCEGHAQTFVLQIPRSSTETRFKSLEEIDKLCYVDAVLLKETLLAPQPFEKILEKIRSIK